MKSKTKNCKYHIHRYIITLDLVIATLHMAMYNMTDK